MSKNKAIQEACRQFEKTGEVPDILLPGFDQYGKWRGSITDGDGYEWKLDLAKNPKTATIPREKLERTNAAGEIEFLGSFHFGESTCPVKLDWHHIRGSIHADDCMSFDAPNLRSIGGYLEFGGVELDTPSLKTIGGRLRSTNARTANLPKLETVGQGVFLLMAKKIHAPKLKSVRTVMDTPSAPDFYRPDIDVGDNWIKHVDGLKNWEVREAAQKMAKKALKNQPSLEI